MSQPGAENTTVQRSPVSLGKLYPRVRRDTVIRITTAGPLWPPFISAATRRCERVCRIAAFSILVFTESMVSSGFFLKKKPLSMLS
jgi:hypothetical protein